jgi:hypothetical protein
LSDDDLAAASAKPARQFDGHRDHRRTGYGAGRAFLITGIGAIATSFSIKWRTSKLQTSAYAKKRFGKLQVVLLGDPKNWTKSSQRRSEPMLLISGLTARNLWISPR